MKCLIASCFGIGNAVMTIPLIKSIDCLDYEIDILIGTTSDDGGAKEIFSYLKNKYIKNIYENFALEKEYDVAILSIPFDGRWKNGINFKAKKVLDGRTRPDPLTVGLISWEKHEVDYKLENAFLLGYDLHNSTINHSFFEELDLKKEKEKDKFIYVGVGYKKDSNEFWRQKHWGTDNFSKFVSLILETNSLFNVVASGTLLDFKYDLNKIYSDNIIHRDRMFFFSKKLKDSIYALNNCDLYVGNDTGMMHVASSMNIPCIVPFFMSKSSEIKNCPYKTVYKTFSYGKENEPSPEKVFKYCKNYLELL